ncbi:hypothetical protein [Brevundimonas sp.]|uniref:hypothetical protein n=1 Tax=Brevundimonas sp. TaxID=1871086 RepID=UPI002FC82E4D
MKKTAAVALCAALSLGACATHPNDISASYVSPMNYAHYTCPQLGEENRRVAAKVSELTANQRSRANNDTAAMTVGLVIFWPALFLLANGDQKEELSRLKGEYDAIDQAAIQKECIRGSAIRGAFSS